MISTRGRNNSLVVDRTCVAVKDVCEAVSRYNTVEEIIQRFQVNETELFECIDTFTDINEISDKDFVKFEWEDVEGNVDLNTTAVSDWVYLSVIGYGRVFSPECQTFRDLYSFGLEQIFMDCLKDVIDGNRNFEEVSSLHGMIFQSFEQVYGHVSSEKAQKLLVSWEGK